MTPNFRIAWFRRALLGGLSFGAGVGFLGGTSPAIAREVIMQAAAGQPVQLPYTFRDNFGTQWDVQADGCIGPGDADVYDAGGRLFVGPNQQYSPNAQQAQLNPNANEVVLPPMPLAGLNVSRRVSVNSKEGWCRWVEVLENPTGAAIRAAVHVNFDLGGNVQSSQGFSDEKSKQQIGLAVFDGNRGIAMLGAGRGGKTTPTFAPQQGNDQVDVTWDVEVPAHKTAAIVHIQAVRPTVDDATGFLQRSASQKFLENLPPDLLKAVVNFPPHAGSIGDLEILRGKLLDVVELRGGDQYKGTIQETKYVLRTPYGPVELPAEKVVAFITVGEFRPTQLLVTTDGEAFGGMLQSPAIHLQLSSGQVTPIPLASISRMGYRKRLGEPSEFKYDQPMVLLRNGDRIGVEKPAGPVSVTTRYGSLAIKPEAIAALVFTGEDQPVHQILLTDGSRFAGLVQQDPLEFKPRTVAAGKPLSFPAAAVSRVQLAAKVEEPAEDAPTLSLSTSDRLVGTLAGKLFLETAFDTIEINGAEIRALARAGSALGEVQVTLWDEATLSGRLKGDVIDVALKSGPTMRVPASLVDEYKQPQPQPPASILEKIRGLVADLASTDVQHADRAAADLTAMGPRASAAIRSLRNAQEKPVQDRIDKIVAASESKAEKPPVPKPETEVNAPVEERR
ncbi:MAG: hypothetical protein JWM97_1123 [Phycisphaerales bacterium]|nr:hypothetical protein [Phycisphaerales bacterium]